MQPKICPRCGAAQQWEMWRFCYCGFDFGPAESRAIDGEDRWRARERPEAKAKEEKPPAVWQMVAVMLLGSAGCLLMFYVHPAFGNLFIFPSLVWFQPPPAPKPRRAMTRADWWIASAAVVGLTLFGVFFWNVTFGTSTWPSDGDWPEWARDPHLFQHPIVVVPIWLLLLRVIFVRWRKRRVASMKRSIASFGR